MPSEAFTYAAEIFGTVVGALSLAELARKAKGYFTRRRQRGGDGGDGESGAHGTELNELDFGVNVDEWGLNLRGGVGDSIEGKVEGHRRRAHPSPQGR
ncbi:hypothetical protein N7449_004001 [Penicillium cf. viridicatum]|uniref:Uncharacterized protein n=1 Tax=Penicillium cf. viridicatum TaxID=2972119 RepID=A0A9W9MY01_9EURO|nr:hypothetical protein N7449_004001 [Penicillium cf. viridicatum]